MVFQLRVLTGTPKSRSNVPRQPMTFMWRRYRPTMNLLSLPRIFSNHLPLGGRFMGIDGMERGGLDKTLTKRTRSGPMGCSAK